MGGGGGRQTTTGTTTPVTPPELRPALRAIGGVAEDVAGGLEGFPEMMQDTTVQQTAGMTDIEQAAADQAQYNLANEPEAFGQAGGAYGQAQDIYNQVAGMPQLEAQDYNRKGNIRDIESFDMGAWMDNMPRGGGGGGGYNFNYSSGGGGGGAEMERIGNPLESMDFANHPALASALDTFAKTALPGIENSMIGAGLGRSGAAANAISTGKATMALPMITELIRGELQNKQMDVTQRGQDISAQQAAASAAASARAQGASLAQQRYMADLAHAQAMRAQDIQLRGQDIGMNQQQIDAMIAEDQYNLASQGQTQNSLLGAAGGLTGVGGGLTDLGQTQAGVNQAAIDQAMGIGANERDILNQQYEAEFLASQRPYERQAGAFDTLFGAAANQAGQRTSQTTTGGGGK